MKKVYRVTLSEEARQQLVELVRRGKAKTGQKPSSWCLPKEHDAEFVWRMEDVLDVYARPYDPRFPVICMEEASKQLVGEIRDPLTVLSGELAVPHIGRENQTAPPVPGVPSSRQRRSGTITHENLHLKLVNSMWTHH